MFGQVGGVDARLASVVAGLAGERPRVQLALDGGETVTGELRSAGVDIEQPAAVDTALEYFARLVEELDELL